jgi:formylglycine-generating enzyme required for sulfatase activity
MRPKKWMQTMRAKLFPALGLDTANREKLLQPKTNVSWNDCQSFLEKLTERLEDGFRARLPTEAEWEYACRAGTTTRFNIGGGNTTHNWGRDPVLDRAGWYHENSGDEIKIVGLKQRNAWGLYDMHGNVFEWCQDWFGPYNSKPVMNPTGPLNGSERVMRGGWAGNNHHCCRSACRFSNPPETSKSHIGFRVVVSPVQIVKSKPDL